MNDRELRAELKKGKVYNQYLLIGDADLLINNSVNVIKEALKVNESFDLDTFSISEIPIEEIISKLYLSPFASLRRLLIVKNLEEIDDKELSNFGKLMSASPSINCIVMTYKIKREERPKNFENIYNKLSKILPNTKLVIYDQQKDLVNKWIVSRINRSKLNLVPSMIHYLEEEFKDDITGLKNEFEKIENYLYETKELNMNQMKELAKGLCDFDKYRLVNTFLQGGQETLQLFEEVKPYLHSYAEIVDTLVRGLVFYVQTKNINPHVKDIFNEFTKIDRRAKLSSFFTDICLELFFIKKKDFFKKGARYGN